MRTKTMLAGEFEEVSRRDGEATAPVRKCSAAVCASERIEIYRYSPDDPVALNKDWYVVAPTDSSRVLLVDGPIKDVTHWLGEIPWRYYGIETVRT
jgi:hypothetical protein